MKITSFTIHVLVVLLSTAPIRIVDAWSFAVRPPNTPFSMMRPPMVVMTPPSSLLRQRQGRTNGNGGEKKEVSERERTPQTTTTGPRYKLIDDEEKFQVAVDVAGMKREDLRISIEGDEQTILKIEGRQEATDGEAYSYTSKFAQSFAVDPTVIDIDKISAKLVEGGQILIVSAPKDLKRIEHTVRVIPITEGGRPFSSSCAELEQVARDAGEPIEV